MAKQKTAKQAVKLGRGKKVCPNCGKVIPARAMSCKYCNAVLKRKSARPQSQARKAKPAVGAVPKAELSDDVIEFVKKHGGFEKAQAILNEVSALSEEAGSLEEVNSTVGKMKHIVEKLS